MQRHGRPITLFTTVLLLLTLVIVPAGFALGLEGRPAETVPLKVKTGVFVMSIYDLSLVDESFNAVFWVWFVYPEGARVIYLPEDTVGVMGTKSFERLFDFHEIKDSHHWVTMKFNAVVIHNWDMADFPFDRQLLKIELEEAELDATSVIFDPDLKNSGIDSRVEVPGWEVEGFSLESRLDIDETTYGDPTLAERSTYPQTLVTVTIRREGTRLLFNLLTAAYIAFVLGILVLFLHPKYVDARKVIITSAMITIIGNHYIISATLPDIPTFTLIDRVMIATFTAICLTAFISVVTSHYVRVNKAKTAATINNVARWGILIVYVVLNAVFYIRALT